MDGVADGRLGEVVSSMATVVVAAGVAFGGFLLGIGVIIGAGLVVRGLGVELGSVGVILVGLVGLQGVAFPTVAGAYLWGRRLSLSWVGLRLPTRRDLAWVVGGYVLAFTLVIVLVTAITAADAPTAERADQQLLMNPDVLLVLIPLAFLAIGPGEELLFRGIIQSSLREQFSAPTAIVLASAMFAPAHIVSLIGSPTALLVSVSVLFVPSLVFGAAYERTGNILVPALIHGAYNATIFGFIYIGVRYGSETATIAPTFGA